MRKLLIFGTRTITDSKSFVKIMKLYKDIDYIITSEKCNGVDKMARLYSLRVLKKKPKTFKAYWSTQGNQAGYLRNRLMVIHCTEAVAIWNGLSNGTKLTIDLLKEHNKPFKIFDEQLNIIEESN
jgi:hypothetical protein